MNNLAVWWHSRAASERRLLVVAVPVIVALLLIVLVKPVISDYLTHKQQYQALKANFQWLQAQSSDTLMNGANCDGIAIGSEDAALTMQQRLMLQLHKRDLLEVNWQDNDNAWQLSLENADGQQLLAWLQELACHSITIRSVKIVRVDNKSALTDSNVSAKVNATLELEQ